MTRRGSPRCHGPPRRRGGGASSRSLLTRRAPGRVGVAFQRFTSRKRNCSTDLVRALTGAAASLGTPAPPRPAPPRPVPARPVPARFCAAAAADHVTANPGVHGVLRNAGVRCDTVFLVDRVLVDHGPGHGSRSRITSQRTPAFRRTPCQSTVPPLAASDRVWAASDRVWMTPTSHSERRYSSESPGEGSVPGAPPWSPRPRRR